MKIRNLLKKQPFLVVASAAIERTSLSKPAQPDRHVVTSRAILILQKQKRLGQILCFADCFDVTKTHQKQMPKLLKLMEKPVPRRSHVNAGENEEGKTDAKARLQS